jgi:hypothetical protein
LPFVATDLEVFREFSRQELGITVKRLPQKFSEGLDILTRNYSRYAEAVNKFKQKLKWNSVAKQHYIIYNNIIDDPKIAFAD